jgi:hypothetical protein
MGMQSAAGGGTIIQLLIQWDGVANPGESMGYRYKWVFLFAQKVDATHSVRLHIVIC